MVTRYSCARKEQSLFIDLFKAFDWIVSSQKLDIYYPERLIFLHACATCSELPSNMNTKVLSGIYLRSGKKKRRQKGQILVNFTRCKVYNERNEVSNCTRLKKTNINDE